MKSTARMRLRYVTFAFVTIVIGLAIHWSVVTIPPDARDIIGDALWALMMTWWVSAALPDARLPFRIATALAICFMVELSQLLHAPALDALRATTVGHLVLGSGFDPRDLAAYVVGVAMGALLMRAHRPTERTTRA